MKNTHTPRKAHSIDHFGEAREYWWNEDYLSLLAQRLELDQCHQLADIGCGQGSLSLRLAPYLPAGAHVTGIDLEADHLKVARQKARHRKDLKAYTFSFVEAGADKLPVADEQMDLTFCQTLLIHVEDPLAVIREMKRITRPGSWVVALEPNNLVPQLMFDRYTETSYEVEDMLQLVEVRLRCEKGKRALGEGFNSLGGAVPDLFLQAGLTDIQVWMSDKALPLIPPYDTREKRVRAAQLIDWIENESGGFGYDENLRYYRAGGGKKEDFETYWRRVSLYKESILERLKNQEFISSGGNVMYIVAGRTPEGNKNEN